MSATFDEVFTLPSDQIVALGKSAYVLRGFACSRLAVVIPELLDVVRQSSFRHMVTPAGDAMSVSMTNCGQLGWITDRNGYRYSRSDPQSGAPWPSMPSSFAELAHAAADAAGFAHFHPDACLINCYQARARLSLHQDRDERDFGAPIVSVSLGVPAIFLFGGHQRRLAPQRVGLAHGDVVVWGREDRLRFHGVAAIKEATHPAFGAQRINLTFRKAD